MRIVIAATDPLSKSANPELVQKQVIVHRGQTSFPRRQWVKPGGSGTIPSSVKQPDLFGPDAPKMGVRVDKPVPGPKLIQHPSGRGGFVGAVPKNLSYRHESGREVTDEEMQKVRSFGPGMFKQIKLQTWETAEAAMAAADKEGWTAPDHQTAKTAGLQPKAKP